MRLGFKNLGGSRLLLTLLCGTLLCGAPATSNATAAPLLVLDPGHEPSRPGAVGVCGKPEVEYNDEFAAALKAALGEGGAFTVQLTRRAGAETMIQTGGARDLDESQRAGWRANPKLYERAAVANRLHAAAFLSVHHDATRAEFQEHVPEACGGRGGKRLSPAFAARGYRAGFSVFIYKDADPARYAASLRLARAVGAAMLAIGRAPSVYHFETKDCASCELVDPVYGVYLQNLAVLRATRMPAILLETGLIVDEADEAAVNNDEFRARAAAGVAAAFRGELLPPPPSVH